MRNTSTLYSYDGSNFLKTLPPISSCGTQELIFLISGKNISDARVFLKVPYQKKAVRFKEKLSRRTSDWGYSSNMLEYYQKKKRPVHLNG